MSTISINMNNKVVGKVPKGPSIFYFIKRRQDMADPLKILSVFRDIINQHGSVCSFRSGLKERTYLVSHPSVSSKIFRSPKIFPKYPKLVKDVRKLQALIGKGLLATHSDETWYMHRKQMVPNFKPHFVLKNYFQTITTHLNTLFDEIVYDSNYITTNFSEIGIRYSGRIISDILSPHHDIRDDELVEIKKVLDQAILEFHSRSFMKKVPEYKSRMLAIAERLLNSYIENSHLSEGCLIEKMAKSFPNITSSKKEKQILLERMLNIIIAGYETTATTISWIFYLLAKHPGISDILYDQIRAYSLNHIDDYESINNNLYLENIIKESMRLYPALWFNIRYCETTTSISGYKFNAGDRIMLLPYLANKHPEFYAEPDHFLPDRFNLSNTPFSYPFGHGPRLCVGKALAEMEIKLIIVKFVQVFKFEIVSHPKPVGGVLLHPDKDINIRVIPR